MLNSFAPSASSAELSTDFDSRELNRRTPGVGIKTGNAFQHERGSVYLGIDPGLNRTGYAVLRRGERPCLLEGGVISSRPKASLAERVREIGDGIREILGEFKPDAVAIEQVFSMVRNPKTAILMAHARGAILYAIAETERPVVNYSPKQVKKLLTGSGTASKEQVQEAIRRELGLTHILEPNDVADACAIALCHYHSLAFAYA
ncbi:crossover junction endodeoxyribonuclease RuvC [Planctomicrobium sp. SH527]|uniref:crossover junction endodeoxyribonuclease RuvC n=1 Tax=Planctomicrobium sp. SH527 TaxID=3448123 RepID=UPI003F5AED09